MQIIYQLDTGWSMHFGGAASPSLSPPQMEGVHIFSPADWQAAGAADGTQYAEQQLKAALEGLAQHLFGGGCWRGSSMVAVEGWLGRQAVVASFGELLVWG